MENNDLYRRSVESTKERLEKELPIMRQNLETLKANEENYNVLAMTIHNIAVILSEEIYRFFDPILSLWKSNHIKRSLWKRITNAEPTIVEADTERVYEVLDEVISKEHTIYNQQLEYAKKERKKAKKAGEDVRPLAEDIATFQHVEYDPSDIVARFWLLVVKGKIEVNEDHLYYLKQLYSLCVEVLEKYIPLREEALERCNQLLDKMPK